MQVFGRRICKAMQRLVSFCQKLESSYKLTIPPRLGLCLRIFLEHPNKHEHSVCSEIQQALFPSDCIAPLKASDRSTKLDFFKFFFHKIVFHHYALPEIEMFLSILMRYFYQTLAFPLQTDFFAAFLQKKLNIFLKTGLNAIPEILL